MTPAVFILVAIFVAIVFRLIAGSMDRGRIGDYIAAQGGRVLEIRWSPFGAGWFASQHHRVYEVRYVDRAGDLHETTCQTSMFGGVYFTLDCVTYDASPTPYEAENLAAENRRLRQELAKFKNQQRRVT